MDYAGLTAGVKVMLPVNEPGALLFIGDGHARQGEGELVGTGLETSMDVEFTVTLVKKVADRLASPRERQPHHGARQRAPVAASLSTRDERVASLADDEYGLSDRGAALLMGQAAEYEIANVVDPHFTVVAKMRKAFLSGFKPR